ncbi:UDP-glucose dehydrogenase family protein [Halobacillus mangrovi]|uniref:UDP-glucose 6-dehydrogenase n=1 Tax=Halobacillus mangrovi TaxID=402384 RepID=A0A1W5ZXG3_9BACI|nr:UDP-glucose/GDP-mannose dehydrogenase family protein [Halobacillus mangrovi]ARI77950.1 UDP-glucose 6-dehydrogenase [Halobacillus mangrovi]
MKLAVVGTGYVGLVTGVCLAEIGHQVTCIDIDEEKVEKMKKGIPPIYEEGLESLMKQNIQARRLFFSSKFEKGLEKADVIYLAVGTPQYPDGTTDLTAVESAAKSIAHHLVQDAIIVTKSTVPVGSNEYLKSFIHSHLKNDVSIEVVHNPEFLREGSAIHDTFHGDRIVIGAENKQAAAVIEQINQPLDLPLVVTDIKNAEMIKYASNAFLATKISFINEIANICEKIGANVEDVAYGMGLDKRIGHQFLKAGIGYGGSCFPKDTNALVHMAGGVDHDFELLKSVIRVNNQQQISLVQKAKQRLGSLEGKRVAVLGLAYKPGTDDMREAASIVVIHRLIEEGAEVTAYDPFAMENAAPILPQQVWFAKTAAEALHDAEVGFILTEWDQIKNLSLKDVKDLMKADPIIYDGRNCFQLDDVRQHLIEYHSVGRPSIAGDLRSN